jgi:hypothetical protein
LIVRSVVVIPLIPGDEGFLFNRNEFLKVQFDVANVGGNCATITESLCEIYWRKGSLPMIRPYEGRGGNDPMSRGTVIHAGEWKAVGFQGETPLDISHIELGMFGFGEEMTPRVWHLWIMGWIKYADQLGFVRRLSFCRLYDYKTNRFVVVNDADYEYED